MSFKSGGIDKENLFRVSSPSKIKIEKTWTVGDLLIAVQREKETNKVRIMWKSSGLKSEVDFEMKLDDLLGQLPPSRVLLVGNKKEKYHVVFRKPGEIIISGEEFTTLKMNLTKKDDNLRRSINRSSKLYTKNNNLGQRVDKLEKENATSMKIREQMAKNMNNQNVKHERSIKNLEGKIGKQNEKIKKQNEAIEKQNEVINGLSDQVKKLTRTFELDRKKNQGGNNE